MKAFLHNKRAMSGAAILLFFVLLALFAPLIVPYSPNNILLAPMLPPSVHHLFGTTPQGQDIFSQLIYGTRDTLLVSVCTGLLIAFVQLFMGIFSGYVGGWVDSVLNTVTNVFLVLPALPLLIVLSAYIPAQDKNIFSIIIILTVAGWASGAKVLRSQAISLRDRTFIEAARMSGEGRTRIVLFNVVPNMFGILAANFFGAALYALAFYVLLQFLGLGNILDISWGTMLYDALQYSAYLLKEWVYLLAPGVCIVLLGTGFGLLNFGVDEVADPRLRRN